MAVWFRAAGDRQLMKSAFAEGVVPSRIGARAESSSGISELRNDPALPRENALFAKTPEQKHTPPRSNRGTPLERGIRPEAPDDAREGN
jgi:hypothetical protein